MKSKAPKPKTKLTPLTADQQSMVESHLPLAYWMANYYLPPYGMEKEDWESECLVCLTKAVRWYDPAKGKMSALLSRMVIMRRLNLNVETRRKRATGAHLSLDAVTVEDGTSLGNLIPGKPTDNERTVAIREFCEVVLRRIDPRAVQAFRAFEDGKSHQAVADNLGVSRQRVTQIVQAARHEAAEKFPEEVARITTCKICFVPLSHYYTRGTTWYCPECCLDQKRAKKREWLKRYRKSKRAQAG